MTGGLLSSKLVVAEPEVELGPVCGDLNHEYLLMPFLLMCEFRK